MLHTFSLYNTFQHGCYSSKFKIVIYRLKVFHLLIFLSTSSRFKTHVVFTSCTMYLWHWKQTYRWSALCLITSALIALKKHGSPRTLSLPLLTECSHYSCDAATTPCPPLQPQLLTGYVIESYRTSLSQCICNVIERD